MCLYAEEITSKLVDVVINGDLSELKNIYKIDCAKYGFVGNLRSYLRYCYRQHKQLCKYIGKPILSFNEWIHK